MNMSLINDALRKARKAQPAGATANAPDLMPVEGGAGERGRSIFTLPFIIAVVLVLAVVLLWAWYRTGQVMVVRGNSSAASASSASKTGATAARATGPSTTTKTETPATAVSAGAGMTNFLVAQAEEPAKPAGAVYKLEGIFYSAKKPAAVINGDMVYVGSRVEDGRVVAIDEESATVVTLAGKTNLLVLTR